MQYASQRERGRESLLAPGDQNTQNAQFSTKNVQFAHFPSLPPSPGDPSSWRVPEYLLVPPAPVGASPRPPRPGSVDVLTVAHRPSSGVDGDVAQVKVKVRRADTLQGKKHTGGMEGFLP